MKTGWLLRCVLFFSAIGCTIPFSVPVFATPEYARETGLECKACHADAGGKALTETGKRYLEELKAKRRYRPLSRAQHIMRIITGYLHMMAAILWFGTIMYVHILLKPAYASHGLPRGELRVGWISMIVVLITGILLTIARIPSWEMFSTTRFGILLGVKIILFLVMFTSALIVTLFIGPRLRRGLQSPVADLMARNLTPDQLRHFDGKEGRPAYIAYKGIIYDMTRGRLWRNGLHAMKHPAGSDLTGMIAAAPHEEDKIFAMPQVGALSAAGERPRRPFPVRLFYFFAYMNLVLVFVITFVIALWRWW